MAGLVPAVTLILQPCVIVPVSSLMHIYGGVAGECVKKQLLLFFCPDGGLAKEEGGTL